MLPCRHCIEVATSLSGNAEKVRFVRRAADLCDALESPVPGLSKECIEYVKSHSSNVYDTAVMHTFAMGLRSAGLRDRASNVFFTLIQVMCSTSVFGLAQML